LQTLGTYFLLKLLIFGLRNNAFVFVAAQADFLIANLVIAKHAVKDCHYLPALVKEE
jgi:hypothetical protein